MEILLWAKLITVTVVTVTVENKSLNQNTIKGH